MRAVALVVSCLSLAALAAGCGSRDRTGQRAMALDAYCTAHVIGVGDVAVESDYLPSVVNCENGAASFEALKVQAVAARSYLYYKLDLYGEVSDGTGDQVYSCGREPGTEHTLAVEATSGEVLRYQGAQVAAFYVAGAKQDPPACSGGTDDPTNTERYVTYNQGKSGDAIEQTSLGWVDPGNKANRGCSSQNGADCLSDDGWVYDDILRFYYGEDIEIVRAEGACIEPEPPPPDAGAAVADAAAGPDASVDDPDAGDEGGGGSAEGIFGGCGVTRRGAESGLPLALVLLFLAGRTRRTRSVATAAPAA